VSAPVNRWKLGMFVVLALVMFVFGLTWLGMARLQRATHEAFAYFDEPVGLEDGSPVKFRGQPIGIVANVKVAPDKKHLRVTARLFDDKLIALGLDPEALDRERGLPPGLRAQIVTSYLTQTSFLLIDYYADRPGGDPPLPFQVEPNTIPTVRSTFRSVEEGVRDVLRELPDLAAEARKLLSRAREDLEGSRIPQLSHHADEVLTAAEQRVRDLDRIPVVMAATDAFREIETLSRTWRDEKGPVRTLLAELTTLAHDLRATIIEADFAATTRSLRAAGDRAAAAGQEFGGLAGDLRAALPNVRAALASVERLIELLDRDPGALLHGRPPPSSPLKKD
jgi:phospholipid/cholesterol/gamma-HCH transport system substrate-binding protein